MLKRRQESVLDEILRVLAMPQQAHGESHGAREIALHNPPKRIALSVPNPSE
jgi:hypothetical protein